MYSVALIEPSPTLRFGINKLLQANHYRVKSFIDFAEFVACYSENNMALPQLLVVGWPSRSEKDQQAFATALTEHPFAKIPALIFARSMEERNLEGLHSRANTAIELWNNYKNSLSTLIALQENSCLPSLAVKQDNRAISVLLVDDSKSVRTLYGKVLNKMGLQVFMAQDAEDALAVLKEQTIDIAIIDYFMPGKNGAMLCQQMSSDSRYQSIIKAILTGTYKEEVINNCLQSGARECMFKNESMSLFQSRVQSMIQQVQSNQRLSRQKANLENILSSVGEGIYGVDRQGKITFANPMTCKILGYDSAEELLGSWAHQKFHHSDEFAREIPEDINYLYQAYLLNDSLHDWETVFWTKDNQPIHVECTIQQHYLTGDDHSLGGSVIVFKNISERKLIEDEINWQLNHDHLTQLLNRAYFNQLLSQEVQANSTSKNQSALLFIDLDNFKFINDEAGYAAGDQVLLQISEKIRSRLRQKDFAARLGGDEFAIILHNASHNRLLEIADSYREILEDSAIDIKGQNFKISGSVGVTLIDGGTDAKTLLNQADSACKIAKSKGKNQVDVFDPDHIDPLAFESKSGWRSRLLNGLNHNQFDLLCQPIFAFRDLYHNGDSAEPELSFLHLQPVQQEVFLRLREANGQEILPNAFLSDAERFDLIAHIDLWVLKNLFESEQQKLQYKDIPCNLNFSAHTLLDPTIGATVIDLLKAYPEQSENLIIELKEHHLLHYRDQLIPVMRTWADHGCRFVIDDFGRNFSLFSRFRTMPICGIKIDGLFTQNISWDPVDKKLMHSMAEVARTSNLSTTVKSVETMDALQNIDQGGIDYVQGYLLSPPLSLYSL